ncbi:transglutaminase family protein [Prosthecobacter vanneervenii]|uniref:Transglutaminase-like putative cysteine protease n=1 Tax=Prosthecobacter vanneervenii TaxID=48466 RepID=A0A7W8DK41_9BACT|nr:transglutaminase family protein [Prosthecobacter vanneervenii]MBB5032732.1 transglutaminase-like putative cysteine protease [Prosthecobacter vanneervenii]
MKYRITHRTTYSYSSQVAVSHHAARLRPRDTETQRCMEFSLSFDPDPDLRTEHIDSFGNQVACFSVQKLHNHFEVTSRSFVSLTPVLQPDPLQTPPWEEVAGLFRDPVSADLLDPCQYVYVSPLLVPEMQLRDFALPSFTKGRPLLAATADLFRRIYKEFVFDSKATTISTPLKEVLEKKRGVCQDFAHLAIASLRAIGLPARYVSGYLRTHPPAGKPRLQGVDASHAWASCFVPGFGWVDFDPTNNCFTSLDHVTVAIGRDFSDVSPVRGIITGGGRHTVGVGVDVEPVGD